MAKNGDKHIRELVYLIKTVGLDKVTESFKKTNENIKNTRSEVDRANKGVAGFAKNSTSSFAKQAQGLGGLVHIYATVAANVFALSAAFLVLKKNADLQILQDAAQKLTLSTGTNFLRVAENMKQISNGALTIEDSMRQANLALASGLSTKQLEDITQVAVKAAAATGRSVEESVQRMVQAVVKGEPELVDEFGIILRVGKAVEDYALAHGKAATELTTFERQQAIAVQAIERGQKAYKDIALEDVINPFQQLQTELIEISRALTSFVAGPLANFASFLKDNTGLLLAGIAIFIRYIVRKAIPEVSNFYQNFLNKNKEAAKSYKKLAAEAQRSADAIQDSYSSVTRSQAQLVKSLRGAKFAPDTEIAEAISNKKGSKAVSAAVVKEFTGRFKGEVIKIIEQLDGATNSVIKTSIGNFSQVQGKAIIDLLDKEELLTEGTKRQLNERLVATKANTFAQLKLTKANLAKRLANYKRFIAEGIALGADAKFKDLPDLISKQGTKAGKRGSGILKVVSQVSTGIGGIVGLASNLLGKFTAWGIAISVIVSILQPLGNFFGLWNSDLSETINQLDDVNDAQKDIDKRFSHIADYQKDANATYEDTVLILRTQVDILSEMEDSLKKVNEAADAIGKKGAFQSFVGDVYDQLLGNDTDLEKIAKTINNQKANIEKATGEKIKIDEVFDIDAVVEKTAKFENQTKGLFSEAKKAVITYTKEAKEGFDSTKDTLTQLLAVHEKYKDAPEILREYIKKIVGNLEDLRKAAHDTSSSIETNAKSITESFKTIEDKIKKAASSATAGGPFADVANQLNSVLVNLDLTEDGQLKAGKATEVFTKRLKELSPLIKSVYGIKDLDTFKRVQEDINNTQKDYFVNTSKLAAKEQELSATRIEAQRGNVGAISKQFALQREIAGLKQQELGFEIKLLQSFKKGNLTKEQQLLLDLKIQQVKNKITASEQQTSLEYNAQRESLEIINKQKELGLLTLDKELKSLAAQSKLYDLISNDKARSDSERIQAVSSKQATDILKKTQELNKVSLELNSINASIAKLKAEQTDNSAEILKNEVRRAELQGQQLLAEEEIREIRRKGLEKELSIIKEGSDLDIKTLDARLNILEKISNISDKIANDDRRSLEKRNAALLKSNSILSEAYKVEQNLSNLRIKSAKEQLAVLKAEENKDIADIKRIKELELQLNSEIAVQLGLQAEEEQRKLDFAEKYFELQKKQVELNDFFTKPEETLSLVRKEFALAAAEFADKMLNPVDRLVDAIEETIDNTVDAFVDTIVEGGDVLKATTDAITDTLNEAALNYTKDILKKLSRDLIVQLTGNENYGKSPEEILLGQQVEASTSANKLLQQIANNTASTSSVIAGADGSGVSGILGSFGNTLKASPGSAEEFDLFDKSDFDDLTAEGIKVSEIAQDSLMNTNTWIDKLGTSFTGFGSDLASLGSSVLQTFMGTFGGGMFNGGFTGAGSSGIGGFLGSIGTSLGNLIFAEKGGIFNALNDINGYKDGAITSGPELAMIGEGSNKEAVVPLPDNRSIPVDLGNSKSGDNITINVHIQGVQGTEQGLRRSSNQIGLQIARHLEQSNRRNG